MVYWPVSATAGPPAVGMEQFMVQFVLLPADRPYDADPDDPDRVRASCSVGSDRLGRTGPVIILIIY